MPEAPYPWLLLLHQIPPQPPYFRAKVLRRLNQLGALSIKNSVYILPENEDTREDFQWLRAEISNEGGQAWVFRAETLSGISTSELHQSFNQLRSSEYAQLLYELQEVLGQSDDESSNSESDRRKLKRRFDDIRRIDFFHASGRKEVEEAMKAMDRAMTPQEKIRALKPDPKSLSGRTWVTRLGIKVDRIGTAWVIRRFVDPGATFKFVNQDTYVHAHGEIRFDMFEGEFTHEGDLCTFEVLLHHLGLKDAALDALSQVVHDIDMKDEKYQRRETSGIAALISGIAALHSSDEQRLGHGVQVFEAAYMGVKALGKG